MNNKQESISDHTSRTKEYFKKSVVRAWGFIVGIIPLSGQTADAVTTAIVGLVKTFLLADDGKLAPEELQTFKEVFAQYYRDEQVEMLLRMLQECEPVSPAGAAAVLRNEPRKKILSVLMMLEELSVNNDHAQQNIISELAALLEVKDEERSSLKFEAGRNTRKRILKSGAGILIALFVIGLFIATATVLRSVVFGLILAYIFLPLERLFEKLINGRYNPVHLFFAGIDFILAPLKKLASRLAGRHKAGKALLEEEKRRRTTGRATGMTVIAIIVICGFLLYAGSKLSVRYVNRISAKISSESIVTETGTDRNVSPNWVKDQKVDSGISVADSNFGAAMIRKLETTVDDLKERFESIPAVSWALGQISGYLAGGNAEENLKNFLASQTSGIFSFTAGFLSNIGSLVVDILLTIFFFALFIGKISMMYNRLQVSRDENYSRYIVRTVFSGKWLPAASEEALRDGEIIIEQVIYKLKVWLKGYLILMCIDFTVYTTVFFFLDVPYFPLLGLVACCGVLLPYIGPVIAAVLTVLVTLALGGDSVTGLQILGIAGIYLWQNGIVDQFFLYPWIIGDALGLTAMETIVVVLLGGIFAGITGMIFALPAAAVIKYLIPQVYKLWK